MTSTKTVPETVPEDRVDVVDVLNHLPRRRHLPCDRDVFENGKLVAVLDGISAVVEAMVQQASDRSGIEINWHYLAGRAVVETTGDPKAARDALLACMPRQLQ